MKTSRIVRGMMTSARAWLRALPCFGQAQKRDRAKPRLEGPLAKWQQRLPELAFLVLATAEYIVFVDNECDVDWETTEQYDEKGHDDDAQFNSVLNRVAILETTPCEGLPFEMKEHFKRLLGEGVARGLNNDYAGAQQILSNAADYIASRSKETSRRWYLSASALMTVPFLALGCVFWFWRDAFQGMVSEGAFWLALSATAGALGALLSVIARTGKLEFDCSSGLCLHYLEGFSRIWAGAAFGVFVGLAVRAELIFTALTRGEKVPPIMLLAAMASGLSERLANSIMADLGAGAKGRRETREHEAGGADNRQSG